MRLSVFRDCAHIGDFSQNGAGNYLYFYGCSDTFGITIKNVIGGLPLILRVDPRQLIYGDFINFTSNVCTFSITSTGILLPLTLINFTARYNRLQTNTALNWTMESATTNSKFIVERSDDGVHFYIIGEVKGKANAGENTYTFLDEKLFSGKIFYRLKLVNEDGKYNYSKIVVVNATDQTPITIYPNPAHNVVNALIDCRQSTNASIMLMNNDGKLIFQKNYNVIIGKNAFQINTSTLPHGIYFMKIKTANDEAEIVDRVTIY